MGVWNTVHLFDNNKFYNEVVPCLRGDENCFKEDYLEFYKSYRTGGIANLSDNELDEILNESIQRVKEIVNQLDLNFKKHEVYNYLESYQDQLDYLNKYNYYEFCKFFEYYLFKYCADFFPYIICGKRGLVSVLDSKDNSIGSEILYNLGDSDNVFNLDGGIINWISNEDTEILGSCEEDFFSKDYYCNEDLEYLENVIRFFKIASSNNLGLVQGQDMREERLIELPQFKLIEVNKWDKNDFDVYNMKA